MAEKKLSKTQQKIWAPGRRLSLFDTDVRLEEVLEGVITAKPPSVNEMYNIRLITKGGKQIPVVTDSTALIKFKRLASVELGKQWTWEEPLTEDTPYLVVLAFFFKKVTNKSWPKSAKTKRFKKFDTSNYTKATEDVIAKATGVDDCNNMELYLCKREDMKNPRIEVTIFELGT